MPDRPVIWRRVYGMLAAQGMEANDLLDALHPDGWTATDRTRLHQLLAGGRGDGRKYREPPGLRARVADVLALHPTALADDARWTLVIEADGGRMVVDL